MHLSALILFLCTLLAACASPEPSYVVNGVTVRGATRVDQAITAYGNETMGKASAAATLPKLVSSPAPAYTWQAIQRGLVGTVTAQLRVEPDGTVSTVRVIRSPHAELSEALVAAMKQWVFTPSAPTSSPPWLQQSYTFAVQK